MKERTFLNPNHPLVWIMAGFGFLSALVLGGIIDGLINAVLWYFISSAFITLAWSFHKRKGNGISKILFPNDQPNE